MTIQSASLSDRGRRANNEDFAAFFEPEDFEELKERGCLYIVADGVGGAAQGERASQFAAQKVLYEYYQPSSLQPPEHLRDIMERVNGDIHAYALDNHTRMATTMVAAIVREGMLHVANVGDSRAYLIRGGIVTQINRDHSIVGEMMAHGEMTEAEAMASKIKNRLTRSIGGEPEVTVDVYPPIQLKNGDKILLCSDGLTRYALREDIAKMTAQGTNEEIVQRLIQFANENGGADNISVVFASYQSTSESAPTLLHIARPKPVDLDVLVTQPGELTKIRPKKRQPMLTIALIVLFFGIVVASWLVGGMLVRMWSPPLAPTGTATPALILPSAPNPQIDPLLPMETPTPTQTPVPTGTNTPISLPMTGTTLPKKKEAIINCPNGLFVRDAPGLNAPKYLENGTAVMISSGTYTLFAKQISDVTDDNPAGIWLQILFPVGKEEKKWISMEACVSVDKAVLESLGGSQ